MSHCVHRWSVASPEDNVDHRLPASCQHCGATKSYPLIIPSDTWTHSTTLYVDERNKSLAISTEAEVVS